MIIIVAVIVVITIFTADKLNRVKSSCSSLEIKGKYLMFTLLHGNTGAVTIKQPESLTAILAAFGAAWDCLFQL